MTAAAHLERQLPTGPPEHGRRTAVLIGAAVVGAVVAVVAAALVVLGHSEHATTRGSGVSASEARTLPAFSAVELAGTNQVTVQVGKPQHVVVRADRNLLDRVVTRVRSGVLVISDRGNFSTRSPMWVLVTVPSLRSATLSGTGQMTVTGVAARRFTARLSGTGTLTASGSADRLDAAVSGEGSLILAALPARDVSVAVDGTGTATVDATTSLDAALTGTGTILYAGHPAHVTKKITGTGTITAR